MEQKPPRGRHFAIRGWRLDDETGRFLFRYECDIYGAFEEEVRVDAEPSVLSALAQGEGAPLLDLLAVALGVSAYKLAAAPTLHLPPLTPAGRAMAEALYTEGLAEFYVRNDLPWPADLSFEGETLEAQPASQLAPQGPALVAFGGGKDSYVARAILEGAGHDTQLSSVVLGGAVRDALSATAPTPLLFVERRLDPALLDIAPRAFGGHVPITAINMMVLVLTALATGRNSVVFANERSADEPTMDLGHGVTANHQFSKSSAFEGLMRAALNEAHPAPPYLYSVLRPYSELWIGRAFATLKDAFGRFTSCNRNFRLAGDADKRWCGECAKCAFTSLILSPFITAEEARTIFGGNFLDREALMPLYEQLLGLSTHKPWDCVGTIDECRAALWRAGTTEAFGDTLAVRTFRPQIFEEMSKDELARAWDTALIPEAGGAVPEDCLAAAEALHP